MISVHTSPLARLGTRDAGGMNLYIRELARQLAANGLDVDVFTRRTDPTTPEVVQAFPGVNVIHVPAGPPKPLDKNDLFPLLPDFACWVASYAIRHGLEYDVMHAHYWLSGWAAHLIRQHLGVPFVQMFHTTAFHKNAANKADHRETELREAIELRLINLADSLIAANPEEQRDLIWREHSARGKICTVPPGVNLQRFTPGDMRAAREACGLPQDERLLLFVGRIDPIKGLDILIESLGLLTDADEAAPRLVLVGGDLEDGVPVGPLAEIAELAAERGVRDRITLLGSVPHEELVELYRAVDLVVVPSRYESFGLVAVEAMASGTPVVASRAGGLPFSIRDGVSGLLVEPENPRALADAINEVLTNPDLERTLRANARSEAERFSWPAVADALTEIYARLAAGQRAALCCTERYA